MEFIYVQPGTFVMGSPDSESGRDRDEGPQHQVTISTGFYLGRYEVTQAQWQAVMGTAPWSGRFAVELGSDYPAVYVSWEDAQAFTGELNELAGSDLYRLPTEAEWEYACRAGSTTPWSSGDDRGLLKDYAWFIDNAGVPYTHEVGRKKPNSWGLYDMHGNVWEWVQDWYAGDYYGRSPAANPQGPESGSDRVRRGGSLDWSAAGVRSARRDASRHGFEDDGFRVLRGAD